MARGGAHELDSPVAFRERFRLLEREFETDPQSKVILWMIFDRTAGWGKDRERIPVRHFQFGVFSKSGTQVHPGTGLSRATVLRRLEKLTASGVIIRSGPCEYQINFKGIEDVALLRKSKRTLVKGSQGDTVGVSERDRGGVSVIPHKRGQIEEGTIYKKAAPKRRSPPPYVELSDNMEGVEASRVERAAKRKREAVKSTGIPKAGVVGALWRCSVESSFPDSHTPSLTQKDVAMLRGYAYRFCNMKGPKDKRLPFENFSEYMDWVIMEWGLIMDNRFEWADNAPLVPDIRFFVGMSQHFERVWEERRQIESTKDMTPRERFRVRLMAKGMSDEAVDRAVDQRFHVKEESAKLRGEQETLRKEREALVADRRRNTRLEDREAAEGRLRARKRVYRETGEGTGEFTWKEK